MSTTYDQREALHAVHQAVECPSGGPCSGVCNAGTSAHCVVTPGNRHSVCNGPLAASPASDYRPQFMGDYRPQFIPVPGPNGYGGEPVRIGPSRMHAAYPNGPDGPAVAAPVHMHTVATGPQGQHTQGVPYWRVVQPWLEANGGALDTLIGLVERGPLADGDVPSKAGRNCLIEWGLAVRTVVKGEEGYQAATMDGVQAFCAMYGSNTLSEAIKARLEGK
jgi:hypothetical protein